MYACMYLCIVYEYVCVCRYVCVYACVYACIYLCVSPHRHLTSSHDILRFKKVTSQDNLFG